MEGIILNNNYFENLRLQARKLTSDNLALVALFDNEARHLNRQDEASRLQTLLSSVRQQLERAKSDESVARYAHNKVNLVPSWGGLIVGGIIKMTAESKRAQAFADYLLTDFNSTQPPFDAVFICVGLKGIPDDVEVVSISRLARESNRTEFEVINEIREHGCLLYSEEAFSHLIDRLIGDVMEGRLLLPISTEKLAEINKSALIKLQVKKSAWVPLNPPRQSP